MNFFKFCLLNLVLIGISVVSFAQVSTVKRNALMVELGGNGLLYSLNYEHSLYKRINARIGVSMFQIIENQTEKSIIVMSYPVSFNYLFDLGRQQHYLESGVGLMNLITSGDLVEYKGVTNYYLNPFINLGYRYEPKDSRYLYRIGLSPFLGTGSITNPTEQGFKPLGSSFQIWGYLAFGFKL